jgi:hypothetical protein
VVEWVDPPFTGDHWVPRLVNGVEALASIFHPEAVPTAPPGAVRRVS